VVSHIIDSVILVTVRSLCAGRKLPMKDSKFAPSAPVDTPDSFRRSVRRFEMLPKRPNNAEEDDCWAGVAFVVVICVILVVARTLLTRPVSYRETLNSCRATHCRIYGKLDTSAPVALSASSNCVQSALETSCSVDRYQMMNNLSLSIG
jgi:hypothetical protein